MKLRVLWTALMAFALTCPLVISAAAQDRDDQNRDRDDQNRQVMHDRDHDRNRDRWENRNNQWDSRTYDREQRPDGWMEGQRANSRYCENHHGCYTYQYQGQPYYYYRDDNGRMVVRRQHHHNDRDDYRRNRDHDDDKH